MSDTTPLGRESATAHVIAEEEGQKHFQHVSSMHRPNYYSH